MGVRIDELLERGDGLIRLRDRPDCASTVQRAARAGLVVPILPGIYADPGRAASPAVRIRAACAWAPLGVIHGQTAVELYLRRPISLPIRLRAPHSAAPATWLRVSRGVVPDYLDQEGLRVASAVYACVEMAGHDGGEAIFEALRRRLFRAEALEPALDMFARAANNAVRRQVVTAAVDNPWSFAEAVLHGLLRKAGISGWLANEPMKVRGQMVAPDVWFPEHRLVLEVDGEAVHSTHEQFEADRERQNLLVLGNLRVLRFTWTAITTQPGHVVATVRVALGNR